jgi:SAM-dependent methyltransferase
MGELKEKEFYDEIYKSVKRYAAHYKESRHYVLWTQVVQYIKQIPQPKILDIGCGTGQFAHYLYDEGFRSYHGFDYSNEAITIARRMIPGSFSLGDALAKSSYDYDYNVAIALEVMEHISDDMALLDNIDQGANVIFSLPTFDAPGHVRWIKKERDIVKRYYTRIEIRKIVPISRWFVCWGTVKAFRPRFLNRLTHTRSDIDINRVIGKVTRLWETQH